MDGPFVSHRSDFHRARPARPGGITTGQLPSAAFPDASGAEELPDEECSTYEGSYAANYLRGQKFLQNRVDFQPLILVKT
jgi:hypothetical protein